MRKSSSFAALILIEILGLGVGLPFAMYRATANMECASKTSNSSSGGLGQQKLESKEMVRALHP